MNLIRSVGLPCRFGDVGLGWLGPHHCYHCWQHTVEQERLFWNSVVAGKWDDAGYTPKERKAQTRRQR